MRKKFLTLLVALALTVCLAFPQVALARGGEQDGDEASSPWLRPALVVGGLAVFAGGAFVAARRR